MIPAYDKMYLEKARISLARMLDFAVYELRFELKEFWFLFKESKFSIKFSHGDCGVLAGMSGVELAYRVLDDMQIPYERVEPRFVPQRSKEYWAGWALAYFQWQSGMEFAEIDRYVPIERIVNLYHPYHEMDISHFVERMNRLIRDTDTPSTKQQDQLHRLREMDYPQMAEFLCSHGSAWKNVQECEDWLKTIDKTENPALV